MDAMQLLLKGGRTPLYTNAESAHIISEAGAPKDCVHVLHKGETHDFGEFKLIVTTADHGDLCPDALGFIFDFGYVRVYYSGDTAYTKTVLQQAIDAKPEIALLPINGAFGNLNAEQAAQLANDLNAKACMPHHFWTFPLHNGEKGTPMDAIGAFPKFAPDCELVMRYPGEAYIYTAK
jgi:L-ascorbate 6-phosphate lactonase